MLPKFIGLVPLGIGDFFSWIWTAIMYPLEWAVSGILVFWHFLFSSLLGMGPALSWSLSIIFLTVVIRVLLIPVFVKQINSSRNMQLVQPKIRELQEKHRGDRERLGQETMKLYKEEGVNPMASCLPLLLQMPIFFALFQVLNSAARAQADGSGAVGYWLQQNPDLVKSLSSAELFGARISATFMSQSTTWPPTNVHIVTVILIILMTGTLFFTQKQLMSKNMPPEAMTGPMAQQQKIMLYLFPVLFAVGGINFPVGVLIYWLTSNLWTAGQQYYIIRANPAPGTPAYEAWEERMRAKGRDPEAIAEAKNAKTRRKRKTVPNVAGDPTRVQRQNSGPNRRKNGSGSPITDKAGGSSESQAKPETPTRNQPQRKSRANRQGKSGKKRRP